MAYQKSNENTIYFLGYLLENGFNLNNYSGILELGQSVPNSLSRYLAVYNQYLLSRKVDYNELTQYGINGAYGYVEHEEITISKPLMNVHHILCDVPYKGHSYSYPSVSKFDSIICHGYSEDLAQALKLKQDKYFGLCIDKSQIDQKFTHFYRLLVAMKHYLDNYELITDEDTKSNKEFILLKRK